MYLSKRNGVFYLWWKDDAGKKRKVSTRATTKPEALQFLREFNQQENERRRSLKPITLPAFQEAFLAYSRGVHTLKTVEANKTALRMLTGFLAANVAVHTITVADCERHHTHARRVVRVHTMTSRERVLADPGNNPATGAQGTDDNAKTLEHWQEELRQAVRRRFTYAKPDHPTPTGLHWYRDQTEY